MNIFYNTRNITFMQHVNKNNSIIFGKRVKELRLQFSHSLDDFVMQRGGISTATWSRVENGKNDFKLSTIITVASHLETTVSKLFEGIDLDYNILE